MTEHQDHPLPVDLEHEPTRHRPPPKTWRDRLPKGRKWPWVVGAVVIFMVYVPPPSAHDSPASDPCIVQYK